MSLDVQFRPIVDWPQVPTDEPRRSVFRAGYANTLSLLQYELDFLGADNVVFEAYVRPNQVRRDGMLYRNTEPARPGVIIAFDSNLGSYRFPCDTFDHWQCNIRAIALTLEAFRKIDRFGVTKRGEQYRHWDALPPPGQVITADAMTLKQAAEFIGDHGNANHDDVAKHPLVLRKAYRIAASFLHPDKSSGGHDLFVRLQQAYDVLKRHHERNT